MTTLAYIMKTKPNITMKNLINLKSILVHSLGLAGILFFASSCTENKVVDSREVAKQENIAKLTTDERAIVVIENDDDVDFLMEAAEMQLENISLGKLAQQKGSSPHVIELGKMMEEGHAKNLAELQALAQAKSVSIPTSATEDSIDVYNDLNDETGNDFGKNYSQRMVDLHKDAIDLYEKAASDSEDPNIRAWASEKLPGLRTHLQYAEEVKEKCDSEKS
jgi:putative membrane protein